MGVGPHMVLLGLIPSQGSCLVELKETTIWTSRDWIKLTIYKVRTLPIVWSF